MIILDGDNIIETIENTLSVKELRAKKAELNAEIDRVKLEDDLVLMATDKYQRLENLRAQRKEINDILAKVNLE